MAVWDVGRPWKKNFPATRQQRCWVHKTAHGLDKWPPSVQPEAKKRLHERYLSPTQAEALTALDDFIDLYEPNYPKACECLIKDQDVLFTFYDFPAAHGRHLRTTNPIESTFGTVRHRTGQTQGCGSQKATMMMVFKRATEAEKKWQRGHRYQLLDRVVQGRTFEDGELKKVA